MSLDKGLPLAREEEVRMKEEPSELCDSSRAPSGRLESRNHDPRGPSGFKQSPINSENIDTTVLKAKEDIIWVLLLGRDVHMIMEMESMIIITKVGIATDTVIHIPMGMVTLTAIRMQVTAMGTAMHTLITIRKSLPLR